MTVLPCAAVAAPRPLLIVATGHTFAELRTRLGDFDAWIGTGLGNALPLRHVDAQALTQDYPEPSALSGVVVSGSHAMVTDRAPWSERLAAWLQRCVAERTPVLGICYGHQLLAHALGGEVGVLPGGPEFGTHTLTLEAEAAQDALLGGLPATLDAQLVHYQSVRRLPEGAVRLAHSALEPHQAYRVGSCAWGVQFHPEFSQAAMAGYVQRVQGSLTDAPAQPAEVRPTPHAAQVLRRFAALAAQASACTQRA